MAKIKSDTVTLRENGKEIIELAKQLDDAFDLLFTRIKNMPISTKEWVGNAANDFVLKVNRERVVYDNLISNLKSYGNLMCEAADSTEKSVEKSGLN